jgi:hypothetical protein
VAVAIGEQRRAADLGGEVLQVALFMLVARTQDRLEARGEGVLDLTEAAERLDLLAIRGVGYEAQALGEVGQERLVQRLVTVIGAGYPAQGTRVLGGQADLLRIDVDVAAPEGVGLRGRLGVPVVQLADA